MTTHLSKDGTYLINDVDRHKKHFSCEFYFILDNWWYDFVDRNWRIPTFSEMQQKCAERGIAGFFGGKGATFPDDSMKGIYSRLCDNPDPVIRRVLGSLGKCAPLHCYRDEYIFYKGKDGSRVTNNAIKKAVAKKKMQGAMNKGERR